MKNEIYRLPTEFKVIVNPIHPQVTLSDAIKSHIDDLWKKEIIRKEGKIFNGQLLSADSFDGKQLIGHFVEYKHYLAQAYDHSLRDVLHIKPISVSGLTKAGNHILIGKRSNFVTDYPNFYELVPSGGIDPLVIKNERADIIQQFKIELREETGIEEAMILSISPTYLIPCIETFSYEICAKIELEPSALYFQGDRDQEYTELIWLSETHLEEFVEKHKKEFIPLSLQILSLFKLYRAG